jgi:hypothetical protein
MAEVNLSQPLEFRDISVSPAEVTSKKFTLPEHPEPGTIQVYRNGVMTQEGIDRDYVVNGNVVTIRFPIFAGRTKVAVRYMCRRR